MTVTQNATTGQIAETEGTAKQVFANKKSVRQSEFYQALAGGLRAELMLEIRSIDYNNEKRISYNSVKYDVIRSYDKNGEITEIICQKVFAQDEDLTYSLFIPNGSDKLITSDGKTFKVVS